MSGLKNARGIKLLSPIFRFRDWLMQRTGLFSLKAKIKQHLFFKRLLREDKRKKMQIDKELPLMVTDMLPNNQNIIRLVVSLTSYGKRVTDALPYTLYSLLHQNILPYRIAVYLDEDHWSEANLPTVLKEFQRMGVEFYYVEDLRSYKKLIPALPMFPDNPILTVDDDLYYHENFIESFVNSYIWSDKHTVLGTVGRLVSFKDGKLLPYTQWDTTRIGDVSRPVSFFGCGGCLYPPHVFDEEILNKKIFQRLAPTADDLWFWAMEQRCGVKTQLLPNFRTKLYTSVNRIEEYDLTQQGTLMYLNDTLGRNDEQLNALLEYYEFY